MSKQTVLLSVFALVATGVGSVSACQYCRMGGDPEALHPSLRAGRSGEERLDALINGIGGQSLDAAPMTVATSAADLPKRPTARRPAPVVKPAAAGRFNVTDAGFLGLAVAGSIFWWRTRRFDR